MAVLTDYDQFLGRHWETGCVCNYYAYRGVKAPHTGEPYTEAMLMGISGGIVMGYFSFAYEGYDPQAARPDAQHLRPAQYPAGAIGRGPEPGAYSRPGESLFASWKNAWRMAFRRSPGWICSACHITVSPKRMGCGGCSRSWCTALTRPPTGCGSPTGHGYPLYITLGELAAARGRVKNTKHRLLTLEPPKADKLPAAVRKGIWDCIKLFTEAPPKGSRNNFGLAAYRWWAELLTKPKARMSWEREFPAGAKMYSGLVWAFRDINTFGNDGHAERDVYADFLEEASLVLEKPSLREVAGHYRRSAQAWDALSLALLPDEVPLLGETRRLLLQRHRMFIDRGMSALEDIQQVDARLAALKGQAAADFPLDAAGVMEMRENISRHVLEIHDIEKEAVEALQAAMG